MSDLISRQSVIDVLKETGIIQDNDLGHLVVDEISRIPTAYDIDKVVDELNELDVKSITRYKNGNFGDYDGVDYYIKKSEAIEIVKQGGDVTETKTIRDKATEWNNHSSKKVPYEFIDFVEGKREIAKNDDVCKWLEDAYGRWHTQCNILADNSPLEYTYCPYCEKKIKVVD